MTVFNRILDVKTDRAIAIVNLTDAVRQAIADSGIRNGQALVCSRHTTTAIAINEWEERLLDDLRAYLEKLAPPGDRYLHDDLHLRDVPEDEPENAHSHLMAVTLGSSETVPIMDGELALGTWQSILLFDLDGPRARTVSVQISGE